MEYLQRFRGRNEATVKGKKNGAKSTKLNLQKKSCRLCVRCRSCGLQQLLLIPVQNNPLFIQRNRKNKTTHHRLTLFRSFSIYKRPSAVVLSSVFPHSQDGSLFSVWYPPVRRLQRDLGLTFSNLSTYTHLQGLAPLYLKLLGFFFFFFTIRYSSLPLWGQVQFLQITRNYTAKLSSRSVKGEF